MHWHKSFAECCAHIYLGSSCKSQLSSSCTFATYKVVTSVYYCLRTENSAPFTGPFCWDFSIIALCGLLRDEHPSLCREAWRSSMKKQHGARDWGTKRRQKAKKGEDIFHFSSVKPLLQLSCSFNFTHTLNAWGTCWFSTKRVLASLQNNLFFHVHFKFHFLIQI